MSLLTSNVILVMIQLASDILLIMKQLVNDVMVQNAIIWSKSM